MCDSILKKGLFKPWSKRNEHNEGWSNCYIKFIVKNLINYHFFKNQLARQSFTYVKALSGSVDLSWLNHYPWGKHHEGVSFFTQEYSDKIFKNYLSKYHMARQGVTCVKASSCSVDSSMIKSWSPGIGCSHNWGALNFSI